MLNILNLKKRRLVEELYKLNIFFSYEFQWNIYRYILKNYFIFKILKLWIIYYFVVKNIIYTISKLHLVCLINGCYRANLKFFYLNRLTLANQLAYNYFNNISIN
jgi:hypothetical protein